jgi:hypothetical protein
MFEIIIVAIMKLCLAIHGPFHQSLVGIGPVVSEEKIKM